MTSTKAATTSAKSSINTPVNTSNAVSSKGPWTGPELTKSPEYVLDSLRNTRSMIANLQEREAKLKAEVDEMYRDGLMAHLVDETNSQKFNFQGVSVTLVAGKTTREWSPQYQEQIDQLKEQVKAVEIQAEVNRAYTVKQGKPSWRVTLQKEL